MTGEGESGTSDGGPVTLLGPSFHEGCWQSTDPTATNTFKGEAEPTKMAAVWPRESFSDTIFDEGWRETEHASESID